GAGARSREAGRRISRGQGRRHCRHAGEGLLRQRRRGQGVELPGTGGEAGRGDAAGPRQGAPGTPGAIPQGCREEVTTLTIHQAAGPRSLAGRPRFRHGRATAVAAEGVPMLAFLRDLVAHAEWANAVFFHIWGKSPARDHEELRRRVYHIIGVQEGFLSVLRGEPPGGPPDGPPPAFPDLKAWAETCHAGLIGFVRSLEPQALSQT